MRLKDCYIGKIIKDGNNNYCFIVGLNFNASSDVLLEVKYPQQEYIDYVHPNKCKELEDDDK